MMSSFAGLTLARVIKFNPKDHSCDCQLMYDGSRLTGVPILSNSISTSSGRVDSHEPEGNDWEKAGSPSRDVVALVGSINDQPIVLGFMADQVSQMLFDRPNFKVDRHASDVYSTIDKDGNVEISHPSGTFVRIATSPAHEDLTAQDFDKLWKITRNTGSAVWLSVTIANHGKVWASFKIDPFGNVILINEGNVNITTKGNVELTNQGNLAVSTKGNISFENDGNLSITTKGSAQISAASLHINAPTTIDGNTAVIGGLTDNGTNVGSTHKHSDVAAGAAKTGVPV